MAVRAANGSGEQSDVPGGSAVRGYPGSLEDMLGSAPVFRSKLRGYDALEVDAYVSWAESELRTVRRQVDDLLARFGACSAELEISRRMLADAPRGRVVFPVSDRVEEMLQLAADEAAAIVDEGARDAEHLVAEARSEADARLRKAHEIKEMAVRAADELDDHARRQRAEAQAMLDRARTEADELLRAAAAEQDARAAAAAAERRRLDDEAARQRQDAAAAAAAQLADLQDRVAELRHQRDQARQSLRGLSSRLGEALQAVAASVPDVLPEPNVAREGVAFDEGSVPVAVVGIEAPSEQRGADDGVRLVRRPAAVPT